MIPGILASWPFTKNPPGPPTPPAIQAPPGTFTTRGTLGTAGTNVLNRLAYDAVNGMWYAGGGGGSKLFISYDRGLTWSSKTYAVSGQGSGVLRARGGRVFSSVQAGSTLFGLVYSDDNYVTQTEHDLPSTNRMTLNPADMLNSGVLGFNSSDVTTITAVGTNDKAGTGFTIYYTSIDAGVTASLQGTNAETTVYNSKCCVSTDGSTLVSSYYITGTGNGFTIQTAGSVTRTQRVPANIPTSVRIVGIASNELGAWFLVDTQGTVYVVSTSDFVNANVSAASGTAGLPTSLSPSTTSLTYGNGYLVLVNGTSIWSSTTGAIWTAGPTLPFAPAAVEYGGDRWVIVNNDGNVATFNF